MIRDWVEYRQLRQTAVDQLKVASSYLEGDLFWSALEMIKEAVATCEKLEKFLAEY